MAQRPKGCESVVLAADGNISGDPKNVYALVISATGATAGDLVQLRNGGAGGAVKAQFAVPAAAGIWVVDFGRYGIDFFTYPYLDVTTVGVGTLTVTAVFG